MTDFSLLKFRNKIFDFCFSPHIMNDFKRLFLADLDDMRSLTSSALLLPAVLTVLSRLHINLAGALSSADVLCSSLVLQGSSEERSAAEAGDGPVVDVPSSSLPAYLMGKCEKF